MSSASSRLRWWGAEVVPPTLLVLRRLEGVVKLESSQGEQVLPRPIRCSRVLPSIVQHLTHRTFASIGLPGAVLDPALGERCPPSILLVEDNPSTSASPPGCSSGWATPSRP